MGLVAERGPALFGQCGIMKNDDFRDQYHAR